MSAVLIAGLKRPSEDVSPSSPLPQSAEESQANPKNETLADTDTDTAASPTKRLKTDKNESSSPLLSKKEATTILQSTRLPTPPKKQSQYMRFKNKLIQNAKASKASKDAIKEIASKAKDRWNQVKDMTQENGVDERLKADFQIKEQVMADETQENKDHETKLNVYSKTIGDAILALMKYASSDINLSNYKSIETDVQSYRQRMKETNLDLTTFGFESAFDELSQIIATHDQQTQVQNLVTQLSSADSTFLTQHAQEFIHLQSQVKQLQTYKIQALKLESEQNASQQEELSGAHFIKSDICKALQKQMVYTNPKLKYSAKKISYKRSGVSERVFAAAFDVKEGTKVVKFDGGEVGYKSIRYSMLECVGCVTVRLLGNELCASASYMIA